MQAANSRAYDAEVADYRTCLTRVQTRLELRGQFLSLYSLIETAGNPVSDRTKTLLDEARQQLDANYPALNPDTECPLPAPPTPVK